MGQHCASLHAEFINVCVQHEFLSAVLITCLAGELTAQLSTGVFS